MTYLQKAMKLVNKINEIGHKKYHLQTVLDAMTAKEDATRKQLTTTLFTLLAEDPDAIRDGWVSHWCINIGNDDLHRISWEQHRKDIAETGRTAPIVVPDLIDS